MTPAFISTFKRWQARYPQRVASAMQVLSVGVLILGFVAAQSWLRRVTHLPAEAYRAPLILGGLTAATLRDGLGLIVVGILAALGGRRLAQPWSAFEHGATLRPFIILLVLICAWTCAGYDSNPYLGQSHLVDRLALLALALLACWRPIFLGGFLWLGFALIWQFDPTPLAYQFSWTAINLPFRLLILYSVAILLEAASGVGWGSPFLVAMLSLIAASYWVSGLGKVQLGWLAHPGIFWLLPAGYAHGWLSFLEPALIRSWTEAWRPVALPIMGLTLALECGALVCLWRRQLTAGMLTGWALLHGGILAASGIAFWHWILIDLALAWLWLRRPDAVAKSHTMASFILSMALIAGSPLWLKPVALAWYDTPLTYTYRLEASDGDRAWEVPSRAFSGYQDLFSFSNFPYLDPARRLNDQVWGSTFDVETADALAGVRTLADVEAVETAFGVVEYDARYAEAFDALVGCVVGASPAMSSAISIQAPGHLWIWARGTPPLGVGPVRQVRVHRLTWLYDPTQGPAIVRDEVVRIIAIPEAQADQPCAGRGP